jgi:hypothetical protein
MVLLTAAAELLIESNSDEENSAVVAVVVSSSTEGNVETEDIAFIIYSYSFSPIYLATTLSWSVSSA